MNQPTQSVSRFANIPTEYNGVNFRSRLEARWAAFFDQIKWEWEYEPTDLQGWIPDFVIKGNNDLLVEIKYFPVFTSFPEVDERWMEQLRKIEKANPDSPVLLLSNSPIDNEANAVEGCFGLLFSQYENEWFYDGKEPNLTEQGLIDAHIPFISEIMPTSYTPSYCVKGKTDIFLHSLSNDVALQYWKKAGNLTQWKRPER